MKKSAPREIGRITGVGCGCKTSEQTGTINGFSCVWHRDKWHVALDAVRAAARREAERATHCLGCNCVNKT